MMKRIFIVFAILFGLQILAQEETPKPYISERGYTILPPEGWEPVSGEIDPTAFEKLPEDIRNNYNPKSSDVLFVDLSQTKAKAFKNNIAITVSDEVIALDDSLLEELNTILKDQYSKFFKNFQLDVFKRDRLGNHQALIIQASYEGLNHKLYFYQVMIPGEKFTIIGTCTVALKHKSKGIKLCEQSFESIQFPEDLEKNKKTK